VAGWLLRKVNLKEEMLSILVPADYNYQIGIDVHKKPHVFSYSRWDAVPNTWEYVYAAVKMTGKHIGPFIEIVELCCYHKDQKRFVYDEYFGFKKDSRYMEFPVPKILYTRSTYLDGSYYSGSLATRSKPSILSKKAGVYMYGGMRVKVIGEQGYFYKTRKNKWILKQCLVDSK